ncbi:Zim17-type zinc finger protein [Striga hermonthica]|uniref:Zim17-type zinc finger protein n=1 Tax=Striga hermonthica TaxID=68872 RepID=A0A9N7RRP0_STRHE|nr:Zim17-type zinc finger protein [Striga hermonthica]
METLATTAGAGSLPIFSPNKAKLAPSWRIVRFPTSPKSNSADDRNNSENDLKSDPANSALVPHTLSKDAAMGLVLSAANVRGWKTGSGMEGPTVPAGTDSESGTAQVSTFPLSLGCASRATFAASAPLGPSTHMLIPMALYLFSVAVAIYFISWWTI